MDDIPDADGARDDILGAETRGADGRDILGDETRGADGREILGDEAR